MRNLEALYLENIEKIRNYDGSASLDNLKQLSISGSTRSAAIVDGIDFLRRPPLLESLIFRNARVLSYRNAPKEIMERDYASVKFP